MVTKEEYLKAKKIVEEYEEQEFIEGTLESMYCTSCQALNEQECICDFLEEQDRLYEEMGLDQTEEDDNHED